MSQHDERTENIDQAIENVEKIYHEYIAAISAAITLAGLPSGSLHTFTNNITECHSMVITECQRAKEVRQVQL